MFEQSLESPQFVKLTIRKLDNFLKETQAQNVVSSTRAIASFSKAIISAFHERASDIRGIVDRATQTSCASSELVAMSLIPAIIESLYAARSLEQCRAFPSQLAQAMVFPLFSWKHFCVVKDEICEGSTSLSFDKLGDQFLNISRSITSNPTDIVSNYKKAVQIAAYLAAKSDPIDIMRHTDSFEKFEFFNGNMDPSTTITGSAMDYVRTRQFILGIKSAVQELERRFPEGEIRVADLGAGALGLLGMSALAFSNRVKVEFVEINPVSKALLENVVSGFGLNDRAKVSLADAHNWSPDQKVHCIISETIAQSLMFEPFPLLIQSARKHLIENGLILPDGIQVSILAIPQRQLAANTAINQVVRELPVGRPVELYDSSYIAGSRFFDSYKYSGKHFAMNIPHSIFKEDNAEYCLFMQSSIKVFGDIEIGTAQSLITPIHPVISGDLAQNIIELKSLYMTASRRMRGNAVQVAYNMGEPLVDVMIRDV